MHNQDDNDAWDRAIDRKASALRCKRPNMAEPTMLIPLPDEMARLMKLSQWQAAEIARLRERVFELEADPKGGDLIPLAEPRCGDLRRSAERCITAWTVVRGGVWDPNGLMDEHMAALRKALGPNVRANRETPRDDA